MIQRILVPLDGSRIALTALPPALSIAERSGATIFLVSAAATTPSVMVRERGTATAPGGADDPARPGGPGQRPAGGKTTPTEGWFEEERKRAKTYLNEVVNQIGETSATLQVRILSGSPIPALEDAVAEFDIDLIVMTSHGRGRLERLWIGSVTEGLIRSGPCPILIWRPEARSSHAEDPAPEVGDVEDRAGLGVDLSTRPDFRRILVPLDGSERSETILPHVRNLAVGFEASLQLASVVSAPTRLPSMYLPHQAEEEEDRTEEIQEFTRYLESVADRLREDGLTVDLVVLEGRKPADAILAQRKAEGADLVAMATRGRGGLVRMVTGSVADKVLRAGTAPVLIHRPSSSD
jgi:nucleotide-binding universal stress UspA family protein